MEIRALAAEDVRQIPDGISGYQTHEMYEVKIAETEAETAVTLHLITLPQPRRKRFPPLDEADLRRYQAVPAHGFSSGLFHNEVLVGVALAEPQAWNNSLWVWEFHIASGYRGQGWGRLLMTRLIAQAQSARLRTIVCETQNSNVPAIRFYRRMGFHIEGVDVSYYSNHDLEPDREVAVFMKRKLEGG